ncbi:MAG: RNHCP domain-containing protein [Minisyncoccia bacterium]
MSSNLTPKTFVRMKEDFVCEHCATAVKGDGYTNHCPKCLWSKHVDVYPGDRMSECGGMMKPTGAEIEKGEWILVNTCEKCGHKKRNRTHKSDSFDALAKIGK